jgi:transcriptional regulator with XRE-family HTH domain
MTARPARLAAVPSPTETPLVDSELTYRRLIGRRVRLQRLYLELSQDEVAAAAGVTRNYVSAVERSAQGLDTWRLGLIAAALSVTPEWLLDRRMNPIHIPGPAPTPASGDPATSTHDDPAQ